MGRLLVFITLAYVLGIILGRYYFSIPATAFLLLLSLAWALFNLARRAEKPAIVIPLLLLFVAGGSLACNLSLQKAGGNIRQFAGEQCTLIGMVEDEPVWRDGEAVFPLRPERVVTGGKEYTASGLVRVTLRVDAGGRAGSRGGEEDDAAKDISFPLSYGRKISLQGVLYNPEVRRNPGGFDYRAFLETQGIAAVFYGELQDAADLGISESLSFLRQAALQTKERMSSVLEAFLPRREGGLLTGMLFGERRGLDAATEDYFRRSGVSHLLAVSGLHTGLVAAFVLFILTRMGLGNRKWPFFILAAVFLFAYVFLTGVKPPALRAFFMILTGLLAYCLDREKDLPTALAAAGFFTLLYNPLLLFSAGFQLSYAATASIITLASPWQKGLMRLLEAPFFSFFPWPRQFASLAAVTLAAQLGVLPLGACYFGEVSLVALVVNIALLPLMSLVLGIGLFAALLGMLLPVAGSFFVLAAYPLLAFMVWTTELLGGLSFAVLELFPPRSWEIIAYYALLFSPAARGCSISRELPLKGLFNSRLAVVLLLSALLFVWWGGAVSIPGKLEVVFLDVGQGDAIYIRTPQGRHLLLDAGGRPPYAANAGRFDPGSRVVVPFLQHRRVRKLDAVIISHPHEDHFGGVGAVMEKFPSGLLLTGLAETDSGQYHELLEMARGKNIPRQTLQAGDKITLGRSLELKILSPPAELFSGRESDLNDNSLVMQLCYKEVNFLFTGDIEDRAVEKMLGSNINLQSQILKVPHHGGHLEKLSLFLNKVSPAIAVISVGKNSFGHPHPATLSELTERGARIYRTDLHGALIVRSNGYGWTVKTVIPAASQTSSLSKDKGKSLLNIDPSSFDSFRLSFGKGNRQDPVSVLSPCLFGIHFYGKRDGSREASVVPF